MKRWPNLCRRSRYFKKYSDRLTFIHVQWHKNNKDLSYFRLNRTVYFHSHWMNYLQKCSDKYLDRKNSCCLSLPIPRCAWVTMCVRGWYWCWLIYNSPTLSHTLIIIRGKFFFFKSFIKEHENNKEIQDVYF